MTDSSPTKAFCSKCEGTGCRTCRQWGWLWSDGKVPRECRPGVACGRTPAECCKSCPEMVEQTKQKGAK